MYFLIDRLDTSVLLASYEITITNRRRLYLYLFETLKCSFDCFTFQIFLVHFSLLFSILIYIHNDDEVFMMKCFLCNFKANNLESFIENTI